MKKIYLDTNFLMIPAQFRVDIFEEIKKICDFQYEIYILDTTIEELKKIIENQKGKNKDASKLGLSIIESKIKEKSLNITTFSKQGKVDDVLVSISNSDTIIATQDRELKRRIKEKGGKVLVLRNKNYLRII